MIILGSNSQLWLRDSSVTKAIFGKDDNPSDSNDANDPHNAASPKHAGTWPTATMASEPAVVHGDVCSATPAACA